MRALRASLELMRPRNCVLTALSVVVGAITSDGAWQSNAVLMAALGAALIAGAGNGMNDVLDVTVDRANRPDRPLPSGRLRIGTALALSSAAGAIGLCLALIAHPIAGLIAAGVVGGLAAYNWWGKRVGLIGNAMVSLLAASTFLYGAVVIGGSGRWWIPALFAALYHAGREIVKGVEDTAGDRLAGVRSLALTSGPQSARRLAAVLFATVGLLVPLPGLLGPYGMAYLAPALLLTVYLAHIIRRLWSRAALASRLSPRLLIGMVLGLIAVLLGEFVDLARTGVFL